MVLPTEFSERMKKLLPEPEKYFASLEEAPKRAFRINRNRVSREEFELLCDFPHKPLSFTDDAFSFGLDGIGNHVLHVSGAIYVQEPSAMAPALAPPFIPDAPVLDVCASPGGKSLGLFSRMDENSLLISNEYSPERVRALMQNIERVGIKSCAVTNFDGEKIDTLLPCIFGVVAVDAPCSGEGMFRKTPDAVGNWSVGEVYSCAERQKKILKSASKLVLPGGFLIYSTCTFSPEEDEEAVASLLESEKEFELIEVSEGIEKASLPGVAVNGLPKEEAEKTRRFYPHESEGEGQFLALFRKKGEFAAPKLGFPEVTVSKEAKKICEEFLVGVLGKMPEGFVLSEEKDGVYLVPPMPEIKKGLFSRGVKLGEVRKGRLVPHHRFFMAFGSEMPSRAEISDPALVKRYLAGEEIPFENLSGYVAVTHHGAVLGGGKATGGTVKNLYPKGLRIRNE